MTYHVLLGPTLPLPDARAIAPDLIYHEPASLGDIYRLARDGAEAILLIDGYFDSRPPVWHKEVLYALSLGIPVAGCSSMGALRAAELHTLGMIGIGRVFGLFRDKHLVDDDEVAVTSGPEELGFRRTSEAMVDIRYALEQAEGCGVVSRKFREQCLSIAKRLFYPERRWRNIVQSAVRDGIPIQEANHFVKFAQDENLSIKAMDAEEALCRFAGAADLSSGSAGFEFVSTNAWRRFEHIFGKCQGFPKIRT
jgi:hypothetical protein